jgi:hypothetical protein
MPLNYAIDRSGMQDGVPRAALASAAGKKDKGSKAQKQGQGQAEAAEATEPEQQRAVRGRQDRVLRIIGGVQDRLSSSGQGGLNASTETAFVKGVKEALTAEYGSTWHAVIMTPVVKTGSTGEAAASYEDLSFPGVSLSVGDNAENSSVVPADWCLSLTLDSSFHARSLQEGEDAAQAKAREERVRAQTPPRYFLVVYRTSPGAADAALRAAAQGQAAQGVAGIVRNVVDTARRDPLNAVRAAAYALLAVLACLYINYGYFMGDRHCPRAHMEASALAGFAAMLPPSIAVRLRAPYAALEAIRTAFDAQVSAAAAEGHSLIPAGCTPARSLAAELNVSKSTAALYLAFACLAVVSGARLLRKLVDKNRMTAILKSMSRRSIVQGDQPPAARKSTLTPPTPKPIGGKKSKRN